MKAEPYVGLVHGGVITLKNDPKLQDGTEVLVTPINRRRGDPKALIAALDEAPKVPPEWVDELEALIEAGHRTTSGRAMQS
jgi:hypothetical protein